MKRYLIKKLVVAGMLLSAVPAFAQDVKDKEKEKAKEKQDAQQIIITRKGDTNEKTVVEIKGDKVTVNGKDINELKQEDIDVRVNKIRDVIALRAPGAPRVPGWNFNMDDDHVSLFTEDANRAMLGVVTESDDKGARVASVSKESAAEKAGLKKGDIITKVNNQKIEGTGDVTKVIRQSKPGEKVTITYLRAGKEQKVTAELGAWKGVRMNADNFNFTVPDVPHITYSYGGGSPRLGLSVQDTEDGKGVKVLEVDDDSNAAKAGIEEDDIITKVNDEAVNSADEISRQVRANKDKPSYRLEVLRNGKTKTIEVKVPRKLKTTSL